MIVQYISNWCIKCWCDRQFKGTLLRSFQENSPFQSCSSNVMVWWDNNDLSKFVCGNLGLSKWQSSYGNGLLKWNKLGACTLICHKGIALACNHLWRAHICKGKHGYIHVHLHVVWFASYIIMYWPAVGPFIQAWKLMQIKPCFWTASDCIHTTWRSRFPGKVLTKGLSLAHS